MMVKHMLMSSKLSRLVTHSMRVVIPQQPFSMGCMQAQRITNPMGNVDGFFNFPSLDLDPKTLFLNKHLTVQIQKCADSCILVHQYINR